MRQSRRLALSCALALACALAACGCALGANNAASEAASTSAAASTSTTSATNASAAATSESASTASENAQTTQQTNTASTVDTSTSFDEEELVAECVGKFEQKTYTDAETGESITYNVYLPEGYDASKSYPTVVFIADSSCAGKDAVQSLSQGLGALVWASDEWQDAHECIVLVPTYPVTILDDHSGYTTTEYVEMTKRFIDTMADEYAVDTNRIYGTGQSMGCMTTLILASEYPDLYAACMFVDGQWDISTLAGLENQTFVYFAAEDDERAFAGQQEVMAMFDADSTSYTYQQWDAAWSAEQLTDAAAELTAAGANANFVSWKTGTIQGSGQGASVHMASFDYAYNCKAIMEWLFEQSK